MGYLLAGAMKGVSQEYLKQSDERRTNQYQEIRDRRLAELEQGNIKLRADLTAQENVRQEGVAAEAAQKTREHETERDTAKFEHEKGLLETELASKGPPTSTVAAGSALGHWEKQGDGSWRWKMARDQPKTFAESSDDALKAQKTMYRIGPGGKKGTATTWEELQEQYLNDPDIFVDEKGQDEYGNPTTIKVRKPGALGMTEYINRQLHPEYRVEVNTPEALRRDPFRAWEWLQTTPEFQQPGGREQAIESIQKLHPYWSPDMDGGGENLGQPSNVGPPRGMLSQAAPPEAAPAAAPPETAPPPAGAQGGTMLESPLEIQSRIDELENMMKRASPDRIPMLRQQIQQYQMLLERSQQERAAANQVGYSTMTPAP